MRVLVPFDATDPKSRLASVIDAEERRAFATAMLEDVVAAIRETGREPLVASTESIEVDASLRVDDRPLDPLVDDAIEAGTPLAVVMADLALATPASLEALFEREGDVVAAPGRQAGTNALVVRDERFRVDYHGASFRDHRERAAEANLEFAAVDSFRLSTDVDEPRDLLEVLVHGSGRSVAWLREAGFTVAVNGGEPGVRR